MDDYEAAKKRAKGAKHDREVGLRLERAKHAEAASAETARHDAHSMKLDANARLILELFKPYEAALAADGVTLHYHNMRDEPSWVDITGIGRSEYGYYESPRLLVFADPSPRGHLYVAADHWKTISAPADKGWNDGREVVAAILEEVAYRLAENPQEPFAWRKMLLMPRH